MYEAICGILKEKETSKAIVNAGGISYRLMIPISTYARLPELESSISLFLSQIIREDAHTLYAFFLKEERNWFEALISVSGIGPKIAVAIVGQMTLEIFQQAIFETDTAFLSKIPGIGKKMAERLVIEMRDKIKKIAKDPFSSPSHHGSLTKDAINALINLGYHSIDAQKAVQKASADKEGESDLGRLITVALQKI